ncbi:hypothetical protein ACWKWP_12085 [Agromyces soli]
MASARLALARARARAGVLAGVAAVVLVLAGLGTAILDQTAGAAVTGLREGVGETQGADGAMRWQIRRSTDPDEQTAAGAAVLDRTLPASTSQWARTVESAPIEANADGEALGAPLVLLADDGAAARSTLVEGEWPDDPGAQQRAAEASARPTALHAGAAAELGLEPGSLVELGEERLLVVGTWLPVDAASPEWFGEPMLATGVSDEGAGPALVDEAALDDLPVAVRVRWTATARPSELTPDSTAALRDALAEVGPALSAEPGIGQDGLTTLGGLQQRLDEVLASLAAVRALTPLPLLLLAAGGIAALARLGTLLAGARRGEVVLLRARGAATGQLVRWQAAEAALIAAPAAALGCASGELALALVRPGETRSWAVAALVGVAAMTLAVAMLTASAWAEARRPVTRGAADETGRWSRAAALGGTVLLALAAVISLWQFRLYGSPLVRSAGGGTEVDPLAVLAPVLTVLALCLGALALTPLIARLLERSAARRPGLVPALPMRQLARRAPMFASVAFTAMLGAGGLALAAAVAGSWQGFDASAAAIATGGEVRVVGAADLEAAEQAVSALPGVDTVAPVVRRPARIGPESATLVATPLETLPDVAPGLPADVPAALTRLEHGGALDLLPVAVDPELAAAVHAGVGDRLTIRLGSADDEFDAEVVAVVDAVPGAGGSAILADLDALEAALDEAGARPVEPSELWLEASDPAATAATIDEARPGGAIATTRADASSAALVGPALTALWLGAAGALLFALAALVALVGALRESRAGEVLVLRVLGTPARTQARARFAELAAVVATAILLGTAAGLVAGVLTASELARAAVPAAPAALPGALAFAWAPFLVSVLGFALTAAAIAAAAAREVRRAATRPGREEVR